MFLILEEFGCLVDCDRIEGVFVQSQPGGIQSELHFHLKGGNRPITKRFNDIADADRAFRAIVNQMPNKFKASEQDDQNTKQSNPHT